MQRVTVLNIVKSLVSLLALSWTLLAPAATVGVGFFTLSPETVTIKAGEVVYWYEADSDFGPYLISGAFGNLATPNGVQFNQPGSYAYTAQSAFGGGSWGGTVNVTPNALPVVTITTPTNNSTFTAPAAFTFAADAYDIDPNDLWDVQFFVGDQLVGDIFNPPFETTVTNLAAGTYTLSAVAWDYSLARTTNTVSITVNPVINPGPILLTGSALSGGNFQFNASGLTPGKTNVLQASTHLGSPISWISLATNVAASRTASFTSAVVPGSQLFRLVQWP